MGWVQYRRGNFEDAQRNLKQAWELFGSNSEEFKALADKMNEYQAINLDVLARISLKVEDLDQAARLFERSRKLGADLADLEGSASAYGDNAQAMIALAKGDTAEAEKLILKAADELPAT